MPIREAVALACRVRLRPILMTSLATILGLIPMAMALEAGSEQYAPLARAIIGGLLVSVVVTVFVVPAAYLLIHRREDNSPQRCKRETEVLCTLSGSVLMCRCRRTDAGHSCNPPASVIRQRSRSPTPTPGNSNRRYRPLRPPMTVDSPGRESAGAEEQSADFCVSFTRAGFGAGDAGEQGGILPNDLRQFDGVAANEAAASLPEI